MSPFRVAERSRLVIAALLLLQIFCWIEVDLYAPSFPLIRQYFGTTEEMVSWTLSINFLGYFAASLVVGPLADSYGRRPVLLAGSGLFILGSVVCVLAPNLGLLYVGRLLQGVGVSAPTTLAPTIVADVHDGARQVKINSMVSSLVTVTMAAAPMAGAWLSGRWGWRANFALILAGALAATALTWLLVPETHGPARRQPFTLAGVASGYRELLTDRFFLATSFGLMLLVAPYWIFISTIPFLFQETLGVPMSRYVLLQGVVVGLFSVLSLLVPLVHGRVDLKRAMAGSLGLALAAAALLGLQALFRPDSATMITALMCLFIVGLVWPNACFYAMVFEAFPERKGSVASLCSAIRMVVMALAIALNARLYEDAFRSVGILIFAVVCLGFPLALMSLRRSGPGLELGQAGPH